MRYAVLPDEIGYQALRPTVTVRDLLDRPLAALDVYDGDTFTGFQYLGDGVTATRPVRLLGVNAYELHTGSVGDRQLGQEGRAFTHTWFLTHLHLTQPPLDLGTLEHPFRYPFRFQTREQHEKYGRNLGVVVCATCGAVLNSDLLGATSSDGRPLAVKYLEGFHGDYPAVLRTVRRQLRHLYQPGA